MKNALQTRMDTVIDDAINANRIVGAVVLISLDGSIVYHRPAGFADREEGRPMTKNQVFRFASLTKPLVSAATLALVERGVLRLDESIGVWLPEFRPKLSDGREPTVTIRHLLTHTAGFSYAFDELEDGPYHQANVSDGLDQPGLSFSENLRRIASVPLRFEPGASWAYSVATDVLGEIVARAREKSLPAVMRELITEPLEMRSTGFSPPADLSLLATPYADGSPKPVRMGEPHTVPTGPRTSICFSPSRVLNERSFPSGGGGMVGTGEDFLRFLEAIRLGGHPILSTDSVRMMTQNQIGSLWVLRGDEPGRKFGFGAAVLEDPGAAGSPQSRGTISWGGAWGHHWFVDLAKNLTVISLTNTAVEGVAGKFPRHIRQAAYEV
jgi:CubicO group peptidase (beta-lactamase class C family)